MTSNGFRRVRVTYRLRFPYVSLDPFSCFDSIIARMIYEKDDRDIHPGEINALIPIRKVYLEGGMYLHAASVPVFDIELSEKHAYTQSTNTMRYGQTLSSREMMRVRNIINSNNGPWKSKIYSLSVVYTRSVSYVAEVPDDLYEYFETFAADVRYIGKKRSLGYGMVKDMDITDTDEPIIRPVPVNTGYSYSEPVFYTTIIPPYWKGERYLCGMANI